MACVWVCVYWAVCMYMATTVEYFHGFCLRHCRGIKHCLCLLERLHPGILTANMLRKCLQMDHSVTFILNCLLLSLSPCLFASFLTEVHISIQCHFSTFLSYMWESENFLLNTSSDPVTFFSSGAMKTLRTMWSILWPIPRARQRQRKLCLKPMVSRY